LNLPSLFTILPLSSFKFHPNRRPKMAKKPMTKSQIVSYFAGKFELTKKTASGIIEEVASLAVSETKKTGSFTLPGIGKLVLVKRKARMGRNPATGEPLKIPAKTVVKMRVAKTAKEAIVPPKKK
jgi:DNA-binding protein HU-beta